MEKPKFLQFDQFLITESANSESSTISLQLKEYLEVNDEEPLEGNVVLDPIVSDNRLYEFNKVFLNRLESDLNTYLAKILERDNSEFITGIYSELPEIDETTDEFKSVNGKTTLDFIDDSTLILYYNYKGQSHTDDEIFFDIEEILIHTTQDR